MTLPLVNYSYADQDLLFSASRNAEEAFVGLRLKAKAVNFESVVLSFKMALNRLLAHDEIKYVYLSKFLKPDLKLALALEILSQGLDEIDPEYSMRYENLSEYEKVFAGVSAEELENVIQWVSEVNTWPTIDTLLEFTTLTVEHPNLEFEIRWIMAGGDQS